MEIQNYGGVSELSGFLSALVRAPRFADVRHLGIVRDAEASARSAFQSVRSALDKARLALPEEIGMVAPGSPMVSVLVLPEDAPGMLETVLARSFAQTQEDSCIDRFFTCIESSGGTIRRSDKARAYAYLSTSSDPRVSVGVAAKQGVSDFEHAAFTKVREFLSRLGAP